MSLKKPSPKIVALAAAAILVPALLFAATRGARALHGPGAMARRIAERLDLTPQQIRDIRGIVANHKQELQGEVDAVAQARTQLFDAIHADAYNEAAIRSAAGAVGQAETQLALTRGKLVSEIRPVLTPEQQGKAREMLADARAFGQSLVERLRARLADPLSGL
jgi:Spy/CpxP family protein refolding chaperone